MVDILVYYSGVWGVSDLTGMSECQRLQDAQGGNVVVNL